MLMKLVKTLSILSVIIIFIVGCGTADGETKENDSFEQDGAMNITIAGGAAGASWSAIGEGIGSVIKKTYPDTTFTYSPGQDGANILTIENGQADFAIASLTSAKLAQEGLEPYDAKIDNIRAVAFLHSMPYHFVVTEKSGIESIEQVVEEKLPLEIAVNTERSIMEMSTQTVLESYETDYETIESNGGKIHYIAPAQNVDLVKDNKIDGFTSPMPTPASYIGELSTNTNLNLLPISDDAIENMIQELGAKPATIEADSYDFLDEDVPTAAVSTILVTSKDVPDEVVYNVVKSMYENLDGLYNAHDSFKEMTKETIADIDSVPLHDGAIKYYEEEGILD